MEKTYGIKVSMPSNDTMTRDHLLGKDWASYRWFASAELRDRIYQEMSKTPENYRVGDNPTIHLEKINP